MHHFHKGMAQKAALTGDTTAQLNREELARFQAGNASAGAPNGRAPPPMSILWRQQHGHRPIAAEQAAADWAGKPAIFIWC